MAARVARRVGASALLLLGVSAVLFAAVDLLPGDVATHVLGQSATPERVAALREQLDLDEPASARYLTWLAGVVTGDLGTTATSGRPVTDVIGERLVNTALLGGLALVVTAVLAVGLGVAAGRRAGGRTDTAVSAAALIAVSLPEFVVAGLLVTGVALGLGWLPAVSLVPAGATPLDRPEILVLPVIAVSVVGGGFGARLVRAVVADAADAPHVEAARLAGLPERIVVRRHLLPPAAGPIAQVLAFMVPYLVGGTVVVERVVSYPGLGSLLVEQVGARDAPVVLAIGLVVAVVVVVAFAAADLVGEMTIGRTEAW